MSEAVGSMAVRQNTSKCRWLGNKHRTYGACGEGSNEQTTSY